MIHYHGGPITPESAASVVYAGGHAFVSFSEPRDLQLAASLCQSLALDNGAYPAWQSGRPVRDWSAFYAWAASGQRLPNCDFAVVPDVIDGSEADNDALLAEWPLGKFFGAPVWHMHESLERLARLAADWPRICIGSSGQYAAVGTPGWHVRMATAMLVLCDEHGRPGVRIHGLRMLNPKVFGRYPLASADSTNIARNIGLDSAWKGTYPPRTKECRARVMRDRIELNPTPLSYEPLSH